VRSRLSPPSPSLLAGLVLALAAVAASPTAAEVVQKDGLIVSFQGSVSPRALPRTGTAPIGVTVGGRVRTASRGLPPSLQRISLEINRNGVLSGRGLPVCDASQLQATGGAQALAACGPARVGGGRAGGLVVIPEQPPFRFEGRVLAFNGRLRDGRPAILAHLYSVQPIPLTFVLAFTVEHTAGTFGTRLVAVVPRRTRRLTHITHFSLHLHRTYSAAGRRHSYLSAGCPAPAGFPGVTFPLVRASYRFDGGANIASTLVRTCRASR
jgi:hypothetical protein